MSKKKITRREFLEVSAGAAGTLLIAGTGLPGCGTDSGQEEPFGRSDYVVFSEGQIGNLKLKNRLIRSATWEAAASNGEVTDTYVNLHQALALGGAAMIITGFVAPVEDDGAPAQIHVWDDRFIDGLASVADAVHAADGKCRLVAQVGHSGRGVGPSETNWPWMGPVRALTTAEVEGIATSFAQAVRRIHQAGWDGVELHGAHAYLLSSFLSPFTNTRTDKFGGSVGKRVQIIADIMVQARQLVGNDFPIFIKANSDDLISGGINLENFPELARELEKTGVDAIDVSGTACLAQYIDDPEDQSYFLEYAEALDVSVPIILTGGNRSVELLEEIILQGKVDFFGLSRPLVREPGLPNRWLNLEGAAVADCISCNKCFNNLDTGLRCHQI